jgi:hypothetical protein
VSSCVGAAEVERFRAAIVRRFGHSVDFVLSKPPKIRELRTVLAQCHARLRRRAAC